MKKDRARFAILNEVLSYPTVRGKDWESDRYPSLGSLVCLSCVRGNKWYLSWVVEIRHRDRIGAEYLLESIEDGELCWWSNVHLFKFNPDAVAKNPEWRWTDKQFAFLDRWYRVCRKYDSYVVRPDETVFKEDGSVTLALYKRHDFEETKFHYEKIFPNWKKTTMKMMAEFYLAGCETCENQEPGESE